MSGHDLSALPEMSAANQGLRSRAVKRAKETFPCAAGPRAAAPANLGWFAGQKAAERAQKILTLGSIMPPSGLRFEHAYAFSS